MKLLVVRQDGFQITRVIVVTCKTTSTIIHPLDLELALKRACDKFARTTEGRAEYEDSCGDFNFGDLMVCMDGPIKQFIANEGVEDFAIEDDVEFDHALCYDTILMNEPPSACLECNAQLGTIHEYNCGKKGGAGHVMEEDCYDEESDHGFVPGDKVFWNDPDGGACSKSGIVETINDDTITLEDGTECHAHELQLEE